MISAILTMLFRLYRGRRHRFDTPLSERIHKVCRGEQSRNGFFVEFALTCIREEVEVLATGFELIIFKLYVFFSIFKNLCFALYSPGDIYPNKKAHKDF